MITILILIGVALLAGFATGYWLALKKGAALALDLKALQDKMRADEEAIRIRFGEKHTFAPTVPKPPI